MQGRDKAGCPIITRTVAYRVEETQEAWVHIKADRRGEYGNKKAAVRR